MEQQAPTGFLRIDKPTDWTSHDVVGYLRRVTRIKKIGHAGTLDPFATGLLIVAVSRGATKRIDSFKAQQKQYEAVITFGATSDTQDKTGEIVSTGVDLMSLSTKDIETVLETFVGKIQQIPPMYSAKKVGGKKLYELAREGKTIERAPHEVEIFSLSLEEVLYTDGAISGIRITVDCSTGTYIRTLSYDIGAALGCGAYCEALRRTQIGEYTVDDAILPKEVTSDNWESLLFEIS